MGLIRTNLFAVITDIHPFYVEADNMEEALEIAKKPHFRVHQGDKSC